MGTLYIVSTPIGNLEDITIRAIKTLFSVDYIACEDTRKTGLLLQELRKRYGFILQQFNNLSIQQCIPFHDHNEQNKTPELIALLEQGKSIALVSDAGTPLINDPGYILVRECRKRNIPVVSIPGPTALISALTVSGLRADKFTFLGYPPEKKSHRIKLFETLVYHPERSEAKSRDLSNITYIFYCAPHKLLQTLEDMKEVFGDKEIVIVRELTKVHEEIWKGNLSKAITYYVSPKGEFVILIPIL